MRRLIMPLVFALSILAGCATTSHSDQFAIRDASVAPDPESGYLYGEFILAPNAPRMVDRAVRFTNATTSEVFHIEFSEDLNPVLIPVPPGSYSTDFVVYSWDLFYWARTARYRNVFGDTNTVAFDVEPGRIYYVGRFTTDLFELRFDEDVARIDSLYPAFRDLPVENALSPD